MSIDLAKILNHITNTFNKSKTFSTAKIVQGWLKNLPTSEEISTMQDGEYLAIVRIDSISPTEKNISNGQEVNYNFDIIMAQKGRIGDITKKKTDLILFVNEWQRYWEKSPDCIAKVINIFLEVDEIEKEFDLICIEFQGTITEIVERGGIIEDGN